MLRQYSLIDTRDVCSMEAILRETYGARSFELPEGADGFRAKAQQASIGRSGISYCYYAVPSEVDFPAIDSVRLQVSLNGNGQTVIGSSSHATSSDRSCIIPSGANIRAQFGSEYAQVVVRLDRRALEHRLGAILGGRPVKAMEFQPVVDWNDAAMGRLRRLILFLVAELAREPELPALVLRQYEEHLVTTFLCCTNHNLRHLLDLSSPTVAPWQVRRAEAYIEANWAEAFSIEDLSSEIGVSSRSVFETFKTFRGYSPMAFLKSVRLRQARKMLETPAADTTVSRVSLLCGFQNLGHFAKDYRDAYGELPSVTLGRNKADL